MGKGQRNREAAAAAGVGTPGEHRSAERPDAHLPEFSVRQADLLRTLCADAVRALGFRARDRGTYIGITGGPFRGAGAQLGFATIAREALRAPEEQWAAMVEAVVGQILGAAVQGSTTRGSLGYAGPALRERLFPRFVAPERMPEGQLAEDYTYARHVGGLPLIMAIRREQTSLYLADDHLAKAGGLEAAWEAAEQNLFEADLGSGEAFAKDGTAVLLLESDHPRQASWLAYPERLMGHFGIDPGPLGVLFSVPALRMIAFSEVTEHTGVAGITSMLTLNGILAQDEVAPLSPHLYWWRPGEAVHAATATLDGHVVLTLPQSVMEAVAGTDSETLEVA